MPGLNFYVGDLRTGRIYSQVSVVAGSPKWSIIMDGAGAIGCDVQCSDPKVRALNMRSATAPGKTFLAYAYVDSFGNETFLDGGPIWTRNYDDETGILSIGASGLWSYFDHRKIMNILIGSGATGIGAATPVTYSGLSLGTIASKIVQYVMSRPGGLSCIVYPADVIEPADDAHTRTYQPYDLTWLGQALDDLVAVQGGPEMAFRPRRKAADGRFLEWVMFVGGETDPLLHQTGADRIWDASLPKSNVSKISVGEDGTAMGDGAWVKGNGSEQTGLIAFNLDTTLTDLGYPLLELEATGHDDVLLQDTLDGYAATASAQGAHSNETLTFTVQRDATPVLGQYSVGDYTQLVIPADHRYLPAQTVRSRITQISGTDAKTTDLQIQAIPGSL